MKKTFSSYIMTFGYKFLSATQGRGIDFAVIRLDWLQ
jgi:hypothetical protein